MGVGRQKMVGTANSQGAPVPRESHVEMMAYLTGSSDFFFESRRESRHLLEIFQYSHQKRKKGLCLIEQQSSWPFSAPP